MKKQAVLIYSLDGSKLLQIADVRDYTADQFKNHQRLAIATSIEEVKAREKKEREIEEKHQAEIKQLKEYFQREIDNLKQVIVYLAGGDEYDSVLDQAFTKEEVEEEPLVEEQPEEESEHE